MNGDELPVALIALGDSTWHDGPGWYQWDAEYPDEGSVGAFSTREEAEQFARDSGYCPNCMISDGISGAEEP